MTRCVCFDKLSPRPLTLIPHLSKVVAHPRRWRWPRPPNPPKAFAVSKQPISDATTQHRVFSIFFVTRNKCFLGLQTSYWANAWVRFHFRFGRWSSLPSCFRHLFISCFFIQPWSLTKGHMNNLCFKFIATVSPLYKSDYKLSGSFGILNNYFY